MYKTYFPKYWSNTWSVNESWNMVNSVSLEKQPRDQYYDNIHKQEGFPPAGRKQRGSRTASAQKVKNLPAMWETRVWSLGQEYPLEEGLATHSIFLPGESHGERSLVGYSPRGWGESGMTKRLSTHAHIQEEW